MLQPIKAIEYLYYPETAVLAIIFSVGLTTTVQENALLISPGRWVFGLWLTS
jgi:hypothetical protein